MSDIFSSYTVTEPLTEAEEADLIARAQAKDPEAQERLIEAYAPAIKRAVGNFVRRYPEGQREERIADVRQDAIAAFLTYGVMGHNPAESPRLAGRVVQALTKGLAEAATLDLPVSITETALTRSRAALRDAEGDVEKATLIAHERYGVKPESFVAVWEVMRGSWESLEARTDADSQEIGRAQRTETSIWQGEGLDAFLAAEDAVLVEMALAVLEDIEKDMTRTAYGFADYGEPVPYREVAHRFGLSASTAQRRLNEAMTKMRVRLGVLPQEALDKKKTRAA